MRGFSIIITLFFLVGCSVTTSNNQSLSTNNDQYKEVDNQPKTNPVSAHNDSGNIDYENKNIQPSKYEYLVHNGFYYVPINEKIDKSQLDRKLGTVTRVGDWQVKKEGDTPQYIPRTNYYSIKGISDNSKIAVEIWGGTGLDMRVLSYEILERRKQVEKVNH